MSSDLPSPAGAPDLPTGAGERPVAPLAAPTALPDAPPARAVWSSVAPTAAWCPDDWRGHLEAVAPGLAAPASAAATDDATGARLEADGWSLVFASRRGRLHAHRGDHREDAGAIVRFAGGWSTAVADGAGSAAWSRIGSAIATHAFTHAARAALQHGGAPREALGPAMRLAAEATNAAMRDFASRAGLALRDLRTTLLAAVMHQGDVAVMQVGDGAMALLHTDHTITHPHAVATGDYSGEVTHFLPDDGALEQLLHSLSVHDAAGCVGLVLATDGVDDPWYPFTRHVGTLYTQLVHGTPDDATGPAGYVPAWRDSVLDAADPVHALVEWLAFEKRGENDDRTLCVVRRDGSRW